jgi:anti-anti-sigma regulatory factor
MIEVAKIKLINIKTFLKFFKYFFKFINLANHNRKTPQMKVELKGHTTIIKDTNADLTVFLMKLTHEHKSFENNNLIIDLTQHKSLSAKEINSFLNLSKAHKKAKKSFVIVAPNIDFNECSDQLVVVPSRLEANDIIEMDEIERDLGF